MAKPKSIDRQQLILDSALELFAHKGFYGVSVQEIAAKSKIALGSMYTYFPSKEALVNELYRLWKAQFKASIAEAATGSMGRDAHRKMWFALGRFMQNNPLAFLFLEAQHHASYLDPSSVALEEETKNLALWTYAEVFGVDLPPDVVQIVVAAVYGAFVQSFKEAQFKRIQMGEPLFAQLEDWAWSMTKKHF